MSDEESGWRLILFGFLKAADCLRLDNSDISTWSTRKLFRHVRWHRKDQREGRQLQRQLQKKKN